MRVNSAMGTKRRTSSLGLVLEFARRLSVHGRPTSARRAYCLSICLASRSGRWKALRQSGLVQGNDASGLWFSSCRRRCSARVKTWEMVSHGVGSLSRFAIYLIATWIFAGVDSLALFGFADPVGGGRVGHRIFHGGTGAHTGCALTA